MKYGKFASTSFLCDLPHSTSTVVTQSALDSRLRRAGCITQHQQNVQIQEPLATSILMKVISSTVAPFSPPLKMEDRKRSAAQSVDDLAPPTKRQAVNGASKTSADSDMPWKGDLEVSVTRPPPSLPIFSLPSYCTHS
jgi:hypothetical protein